MGIKKTAIIRRGVQILCFVFLPALFIEIFYSMKTILSFLIRGEGTRELLVPSVILFLSITLLTVVFGRFFCGWMCSFGAVEDLLYHLPRIGSKKQKVFAGPLDTVMKSIKYFILFISLVVVWGLQISVLPDRSNPWEVFGMLTSVKSWPTLAGNIGSFAISAVILGVIFFCSLFIERFFCRYLCPVGAYLAIVSRLGKSNIVKKQDQCQNCTLCHKRCSMGISLGKMDRVSTGECIQCAHCSNICPKKNAHYEMGRHKVGTVLAGLAVCVLLAGGYFLGNRIDVTGSGTAEVARAEYDGPAEPDTQIKKRPQNTEQGQGSYDRSDQPDTQNEKTTDNTETEQGTEAVEDTKNAQSTTGKYKDGVYTGQGTGFRGPVEVQVTVENGEIKDIEVLSASDDGNYLQRAMSGVVSAILNNQSSDVDAVSGATFSSNGIKEAVADALGEEFVPSEVTNEGHGHGGPGRNH